MSEGPSRLDLPRPDGLASRLFPPLPASAEWGTGRVGTVLGELGHPQRRYPSLHIAGTNGKGSVACVWESVLAEDGRRVGLYTSPHLVSFRERIRIDRRPVSESALRSAAGQIEDRVVAHGLTFFEAATVLAFQLFALEHVDVAVVEVGLGGRLDATNVLDSVLTAVTNVALDHQEFLGNSLEQIAREKAAIARPSIPFVTAERDPSSLRVLRGEAEAKGGTFHDLRLADQVHDPTTDVEGSRFELETTTWGRVSLRSPMIGRHQISNVALAVRGLDLLPGTLRPGRDAVTRGVEAARWPGRLQVERVGGRTWVFDVAHNPAGAEALAAALESLDVPEPLVFLVGILADKDHGAMLSRLMGTGEAVAVLTNPASAPEQRRWDPERVAGSMASDRVVAVAGFIEAMDEAERRAGTGGTIVVTGSHFTVGEGLGALDLLRLPEQNGSP